MVMRTLKILRVVTFILLLEFRLSEIVRKLEENGVFYSIKTVHSFGNLPVHTTRSKLRRNIAELAEESFSIKM